jgi:hypothetical protein
MHEKAALFRQNQGVSDAEHGVDGLGVGALANPAAARAGVPLCAEVSPFEVPKATLPEDLGILIGWLCGWVEVNLESIDGLSERIQEAGVALFEKCAEVRMAGLKENRDSTDFDNDGLRCGA